MKSEANAVWISTESEQGGNFSCNEWKYVTKNRNYLTYHKRRMHLIQDGIWLCVKRKCELQPKSFTNSYKIKKTSGHSRRCSLWEMWKTFQHEKKSAKAHKSKASRSTYWGKSRRRGGHSERKYWTSWHCRCGRLGGYDNRSVDKKTCRSLNHSTHFRYIFLENSHFH